MDKPDLTDQELALLRALAEEWDRSGPPGYLETDQIARGLQLTVPEAKRVLHSLFVRGLAGTDEIDHHAGYLLPEGYEIARK
jgi:hypothetical protein